jgi:hypothetical protein
MKRFKKIKSAGIKSIFLVILVFCLVVFSSPDAGDAFVRKINVLFNKISTPIEFIKAGRSFDRIEKVGGQIHNYSKEKEQIGDYRSQKIIKNAEAKYGTGQFSRSQRDSEIKRAKAIRNAYYEYARQIRRYGRSAGKYETRRTLRPIVNIALRSKKAGRAFQKAYENLNKGKKALQTIRGEIDKALELVESKSNTAIARLQRIRDKLNRHGDNFEIAYEATQQIGLRGRAIDDTLGNGADLSRALSAEVGELQNRIRKGEQNIREFGERLKKQAEKTEKRLTRAEERLRKFKEEGFNTEVRRDRFSLAQFRARMKDKKDILERRSQIARLMAQRSGLGTDADADLPKLTDTTEDQSSPFGDSTRSTEDLLARRKDTHDAQLASQQAADSGVTRRSSRQKLQARMKKTQAQIEEDARIKAQKEADKKARDRAVAQALADAAERKRIIAELKKLNAQNDEIEFDEKMTLDELRKILADARKKAAEPEKDKEEKPEAECTNDAQCEKSHGPEYRCDDQTGKCVKKKPEPECTDDPQCVKLHGKDYRCDNQTGKCVKKKPEPECTDDPQCVKLHGKDYRCDDQTGKCVKKKPEPECTDSAQCEKSRGPEYRCDDQTGKCVKKKCSSHAQCKAWKGSAYRCDFENGECVAECANHTDCEKLYDKSYECKPPRCVQKKCTGDPQCEQWKGEGFKCDTQTGNCVKQELAIADFPRTYTGTLKGTLTATALFGVGGTQVCNYTSPMELTLLASGLVNVTIYEHGNPHFDNTGRGTRCSKYKQEVFFLGTHSKGILKFATGKGKYDENKATGDLKTDEVIEKMAYGEAKFTIINSFELDLKKAGM